MNIKQMVSLRYHWAFVWRFRASWAWELSCSSVQAIACCLCVELGFPL